MFAKVFSAGLAGIDGRIVSVEIDESNGLPHSVVIGNVSLSVKEALERCTIALKNSGILLPPKRLTISLQPADFHKSGTSFDLPILVGLLAALHLIDPTPLKDYAFFGEVGLDGSILHVRGALPLTTAFLDHGLKGAIMSMEDVQEAMVVEGMDILGVSHVLELISLLQSEASLAAAPRPTPQAKKEQTEPLPDFRDIHGQQFSVRAAFIAAAGGHNILLSGVAGSGKSMIAKRIPSILPPITREEDIAVTKIYSVSGLLPPHQALYGRRPFRSPHASITVPALIGGSSGQSILPGEIALASKGVLFLDELPLFSRPAIEALRQPMEDKKVVISRVNYSISYPADCMIVAAMNPCPCGFYPDRSRCTCSPGLIRSYQRGISKPILERIDLCVDVAPVSFSEATQEEGQTDSETLRAQVIRARTRQRIRFSAGQAGDKGIKCNAEMGMTEIQRYCALSADALRFMKKVYEQKQLSMRTYHKILKVARTIADLAEEEHITIPHLAEALSYRGLEDRLYGNTTEEERRPFIL